MKLGSPDDGRNGVFTPERFGGVRDCRNQTSSARNILRHGARDLSPPSSPRSTVRQPSRTKPPGIDAALPRSFADKAFFVSRGEQSRTDSVVSKAGHFCATR